MQFSNRVTVIYNSLNDFAEEVAQAEKTMRCCITYYSRTMKKDREGSSKRYDLKLITSGRSYEPYKDLFDKGQTLLFKYGDYTYEPILVAAINDFSGKVRYYEIELREVKGA